MPFGALRLSARLIGGGWFYSESMILSRIEYLIPHNIRELRGEAIKRKGEGGGGREGRKGPNDGGRESDREGRRGRKGGRKGGKEGGRKNGRNNGRMEGTRDKESGAPWEALGGFESAGGFRGVLGEFGERKERMEEEET